jgi:AraC family transcriptional regulator, regulatory protein of adaptative response / methylated-DNA-[protein]-cysteine methyltransferase
MLATTLPAPSVIATDLRFALGHCALGALLVAWSERGITAIELGDEVETLAARFIGRTPEASLIHGGAEVEQLLDTIGRFVEDPALGLDLPLDVQGTAFEQRVWQALRGIPAGTTASYGEIARRIGAPTAARAVARACAANRLAVAIPCHRVVGQDGSLTGYRWGIARKAQLLTRERR